MSLLDQLLDLKSKLVRISSEDKSNSSESNSRFTVDLNQNGTNIDRVAGIVVKFMSCANVFPNIPTYANGLQLVSGAGATTYNVSVPVGQYTASQFITALQTAINAVILDTVTITISAQDVLTFQFAGDDYTLIYDNSTIKDKIGLTSDLFCGDGILTPLQSLVNLIGETELYVHSKQLNNAGLIEPQGNFAVVDLMSLDSAYGGMSYSNFNDVELHKKKYIPYESQRSLRTIDIVLRNRRGNVLELPPNYNFNMVIIIYYT